MKYIAEIDIMLHKELPDPQGETVARTLRNIHIADVENLRIGKHISMTLEADSKEEAIEKTDAACQKLLANSIMESYSFFIHKEEGEGEESEENDKENSKEVLHLSELGDEGNINKSEEVENEAASSEDVLLLPELDNDGSGQENDEVLHLPKLDADGNNKEPEEPPLA